jgi:hypothetical protein
MDADIFIYTGEGGDEVPDDVVRVRVDPSVTSIPADAFHDCNKLTEVELCEGLVEIGSDSFSWSDHSTTKINIPTSLRRICNMAFHRSLRCTIRLHDGIESIGEGAFSCCIFTNFRVPPLITAIPEYMLGDCTSMFSVEIPHQATLIDDDSLTDCYCLRNVAFPPDALIGISSNKIFFDEEKIHETTDLQRLFGSSNARIIWGVQNRFYRRPIHEIIYYQSYNQGVLQNLMDAIKLDSTGNQQDCLGMTPLHILACSSVHDLEVYRVIVRNYPTNLITEDRWGAIPLLYLFWGAAPAEIIQFLLDCYKLLYPDHVFNWTMMVKTMGRCDTPKESIENLLRVKQMHFPDQPIDWEHLLDEFASPPHVSFPRTFKERMQFLVMCGLSERVEALAFKVWRDHIIDMIHTANFLHNIDNSNILHRIQEKLTHFEDELPKLKEISTILELALWRLRMKENIPNEEEAHCQKKIKTDESSIRQQCRVTCGADVVIRHVMPYLLSTEDEE